MKVYAEKLVETVVDKICDVCEESVIIELNSGKYEESGELRATFGYGSQEDGNVYNLDLCEKCFKAALYALREKCREKFMLDDDKFGLDPKRSLPKRLLRFLKHNVCWSDKSRHYPCTYSIVQIRLILLLT